MVAKWPAAGLKRCPKQKAEKSKRGCSEKKNKEGNGAKKDLEGAKIAFLLQPLTLLQSGGLAHSNEAIKKPETWHNKSPSHSMDARNKAIRKGRSLQGHAAVPSLNNNQVE